MTPPIFTPDGTEVEEVILPDGSAAAEVIAPDGTVVFDDTIPDSVVSRPGDSATTSNTTARGLVINPNDTFEAVGARISSNTSGFSRARLYSYNDGQYIETVDISDKSAGDTFSFDSEIQEGQDYGIEIDDDGNSWTMGFASSVDYPYTGDDIDIVAHSEDGSSDDDRVVASINDIGDPDGVLD